MARTTPARRACDRAARACAAAHRALGELLAFLPEEQAARALRHLQEMREWADCLDRVTWPDRVEG